MKTIWFWNNGQVCRLTYKTKKEARRQWDMLYDADADMISFRP